MMLTSHLPVTHDLTLAYVLSLAVALLMTIASLAGLSCPACLYPTEELQQSFVATDVVNLLIGLPVLLGSMWLARRGRLLGLLFWPGALFYVLYHAIVYSFALPLNLGFLFSIALLVLSAYAGDTTIGLVASIDSEAVQRRLSGAVPERVAGGALVGSGILFSLLAVGTIVNGLVNRAPMADGDCSEGPPSIPPASRGEAERFLCSESELALQVSDFLITPAWIIGGMLLWRRKPLGYVTATGLLFQASMLFIGLIVFLLLRPLLTAASFVPGEVVVTFILGLICFIPFALFLRGFRS